MTTLTTVLSAIAALFAVLIATLQYRNSNYRIKMDLFEKRYDFYLKLRGVLVMSLRGINEENRSDILRQVKESERLSIFLFDDAFAQEIQEIRKRVEGISEAYKKLQGENRLPEGNERDAVADRKMELFKEIESDIDTLEMRFSRFMKLNK